MLGTDVLVIQALCFFSAIGEYALALMAQRKIHRGGNLLANGGVRFDLLPNGLDGRVRPQEAIGQRLVLSQQPEQQVFRLDVRTTELAGLVSREENHAPGLFGISFKHDSSRLLSLQSPASCPAAASPRSAGKPERRTVLNRLCTLSFPRVRKNPVMPRDWTAAPRPKTARGLRQQSALHSF